MSPQIKKGEIQSLNMIQSLTVISGRLWITQANDSKDYILTAGDVFFAAANSQVILEALSDSEIHFSEPIELPQNKKTESKRYAS